MNATTTPATQPTDLVGLCRRILTALESLTPEQFAMGGDRPIREALAVAVANSWRTEFAAN